MAYATDAARWRALTVRDANANGHFIYSVKSTNIYCRPTCPGRLARRANVGFYATWVEAEAAGFRACKRCKPNNAVLEDPQERAVKRACELIEETLKSGDASTLRLQVLAKKVNLTPRYFHKIFKEQTGLTPKEYAKRKAIERSKGTTASIPTIDAEASAPAWDGESLDFNSLNNMGSDSSLTTMNDFAIAQDQSLTLDPNVEFDATGLFQPWGEGYEPAQSIQWQVADVHVADSLQTALPDMAYYEKAIPSISALELNAAALLNCDGPDILQLQSL